MLNKKRFFEKLEKQEYSNKGEEFEFAMVIAYPTTRYYPYNPASKSGDIVAMGTHYQIKGHRGFFQNVANLEELENHLYNECKAHRYLLRVTEAKKYWWVDVDKEGVLQLAKLGYIKFENAGKSRGNIARWSMTIKEAIHLKMNTGIPVIKAE